MVIVVISGLKKVWTMSPVFRAENSKSTKHLSEFYMLEAEECFAYDIMQIISTIENLVKFCIRRILVDNIDEWKVYTNDDKNLRVIEYSFSLAINFTGVVDFVMLNVFSEFVRITYDQTLYNNDIQRGPNSTAEKRKYKSAS